MQQRRVRLSPEKAADFYAEHYGKMFFPSLIAFMSSDDIIVLVLAKPNAISDWRECLGPTDARRAKVTETSSYVIIMVFCSRKKFLKACVLSMVMTIQRTHYMEAIVQLVQKEKSNLCFQTVSVLYYNKIYDLIVILATSVLEPVIKGDDMKDYLQKQVNQTLVKGLTELCRQKPQDPLVSKHYFKFVYFIL